MIKDQELQKLILRALKWNEAGKPIESQLERLKNASFRGVLNNPDLLRDEDLVQLLGPYLDHGSFAPAANMTTNMDFSTKMLDQNVTEMEVGVDPELFFPFDDDESNKGMDVEVTKVVKPKKERKKSEARASKAAAKKAAAAGSSSVNSSLSTPPKIRIKTEGLFKSVSHSLASKNAIPIPKPVIVVPTTPTKSTAAKTMPKPKIVTELPAVKVVAESTLKQNQTNIDKPVIVQSPPNDSATSSTEVSTTTPPSANATTLAPISKTPSTVDSVQTTVNATATNSIVSPATSTATVTTTTTTAPTPVLPSSPPPPAADAVAATTVSKPAPKISTSKAEPRVRQARNSKVDQIGPKTRARSVFNTRHKCAVCGKR